MNRIRPITVLVAALFASACGEPASSEDLSQEDAPVQSQVGALVDVSGDLSSFPRRIWPYILVDPILTRALKRSSSQ